MQAPYYTVDVESITGSWSYSYTHLDVPDPDLDVHLADSLTYNWAYESGVVPGQLQPATGTVGFWCRDAATVPVVDVGHILLVTVTLITDDGTTLAITPVIIEKHMRVTSAEVTLTPVPDGVDPDTWFAAYLALDLVDLLAELRSMVIDRPLGIPPGTWGGIGYSQRDYARQWWRPRLAEVGALVGRSVGNPDWWDTYEQPAPMTFDGVPASGFYASNGLAFISPDAGNWEGKSAHQLLVELLNSHQPNGLTHTVVGVLGTGGVYPVADYAYEYVGTTIPHFDNEPPPTDPASDIQYLIVSASRESGGDGHTATTLDGDWLLVPAKARRSREHVINTVRVGGRATIADPADPLLFYKWTDSALTFTSGDAANGPSARDLPTQLRLHNYPNDNPVDTQPVAPGVVAPRFLTDASARDAWTYESFQLVSSSMPQTYAREILPALAPRFPGETDGDGQVLRHVTLTNLDPSIEFPDPVSGFVVAGQLTVTDGDLLWNLTLTPGDPT